MEDNWKGIKEALTSTCQEQLGRNKHHHKEWISIETLDEIEEMKNKKTAINIAKDKQRKSKHKLNTLKQTSKPAPMNPLEIEAAHTDIPIDVNPPTKEEIRMEIRQIKSGKAAGPDNITAKALKSDIELTTSMP
ncbi:unnamed protein product [Schistosoma mattheei]|uniref:Uncharacterized protein n=1 Tax=Schistosoma mattheei TaxID=31246 RepID=A0A183NQX3_9TREM|nr:unnamed protein product [Schistosoma mattheei]